MLSHQNVAVAVAAAAVAVPLVVALRKRAANDETDERIDPKLAALEEPPAYMGLPFFGVIFQIFGGNPVEMLMAHRHEKAWRTRLLGHEVVIVSSREGTDVVYRGEGRYTKYLSSTTTGKHALGKAISFINDFEEHRTIRKPMISCFRPSTLAQSSPGLQFVVQRFLKKWARDGQFNAEVQLTDLSFDAGITFCGVHVDRWPEERKLELRNAFQEVFRSIRAWPIDLGKYSQLGRARIAKNMLDDEMDEVLQECKQKLDNKEEVEDNIMRRLIESCEESGISWDIMRDNFIGFMIGAFDTTSSTMLSFILSLCKHPEAQDKAFGHIKEVLGEDSDEFHGRKELTMEQIGDLTYVHQIVHECERFHPPLTLTGGRVAMKDFELCGYRIKKGTRLILGNTARTRNPEYFSDPDTFNPDRFSDESAAKILNTFGGGRRKCVGYGFANLERKIFAINLLRDYRISFADEEAAKALKVTFNPLLGIDGELIVNLVPREKK